MIGWIKLHRKLLVSDMYLDLNAVQRDVLVQCLLAANHKSKKWNWQGTIFECKAGQFITSLDSLVKLCSKDTSTQNVRTALVKLEKWQFLTNESTKTGRLITVINWHTYQNDEEDTNKAIDKELTKHQQSSNKELTTNKNEENVKNEKKEIKTGGNKRFSPPSLEEVKAYCDERNKGVNPETWIDHYTSNGWKVGKNKMVNWKAAVRTWESKGDGNGKGRQGHSNTRTTSADRAADKLRELEEEYHNAGHAS